MCLCWTHTHVEYRLHGQYEVFADNGERLGTY